MRTWTVRLSIVALLIVAAVAFGVRAKNQMYDFNVYLTAGARVIAGESLYRAEDGHWQYKYLPAFAFVIAPLSVLPPVVARGIWFAFSVGLLIVFINRALVLLPDRRMTAQVLVGFAVLAMGKFYAREVGLGQANLLLAVLVLVALDAGRRGHETLAGLLLAAATIVKPYAILFLPYLLARRRIRAAAWFVGGVALAVLLPVVRYGVGGNLDLLSGLWHVVTTSTAPNLAGQDNVSIAGMFAAWFGVGPAASRLATATAAAVLAASAWVLRRRGTGTCPEYLDAAVLLFLMPLLSPQGWDYILLITTPAVMLLIDRTGGDAGPLRVLLFACLVIVGLSLWDVMGRDWYRAFMMARVVSVCALIELAMVLRLRVLRSA